MRRILKLKEGILGGEDSMCMLIEGRENMVLEVWESNLLRKFFGISYNLGIWYIF